MSKACKKCGNFIPLKGFYRSKRTKDGREGDCKECRKQYDLDRKDEPHRKKMKYESTKRMREKCPEKHRAHQIVKRAVRNGTLVKSPCTCRVEKVLGHHEDYSKPLEVIWMCTECHTKLHVKRKNDGKTGRSNNSNS